MAELNTVWVKTLELNGAIKSLIRLSTFEQDDDLSGLNINDKDAEQRFLLDELRGIMDKLSDVEDRITYFSRSMKEESRLHLNECGKYETKGGHFYSCGYGVEALVSDDYHDTPRRQGISSRLLVFKLLFQRVNYIQNGTLLAL